MATLQEIRAGANKAKVQFFAGVGAGVLITLAVINTYQIWS